MDITNPSVYLPILSVIANVFVGIILYRQIKSQKAVIENYKGYVEAVNPDKIIALHNKELEQLKKITDFDKDQLIKQVLELGIYVDNYLTHLYSFDTPDSIDRETHVNRNMPNSAKLLKGIHNHFASKIPKAQ